MIVLDSIIRSAINPALSLLPVAMDCDAARVMLLAITLQEADAVHRVQFSNGAAHGLWMFEEGGGVKGVMQHPASRDFALSLCSAKRLVFDRYAIWQVLKRDDILAAGFARLLLWTDTQPLPDVDDADGAWSLYLRTWRPGKPRPIDWPKNHAAGRAQVLA